MDVEWYGILIYISGLTFLALLVEAAKAIIWALAVACIFRWMGIVVVRRQRGSHE